MLWEENEKAMLYIKECAESVGIEVIEGETAFSIPFMAEVMRRLREEIDKYKAEGSDNGYL